MKNSYITPYIYIVEIDTRSILAASTVLIDKNEDHALDANSSLGKGNDVDDDQPWYSK